MMSTISLLLRCLLFSTNYTKALTRQCVSITKPALKELFREGPRHHKAMCIHLHKYKIAAWIGVQEEQVLGKGSGRRGLAAEVRVT